MSRAESLMAIYMAMFVRNLRYEKDRDQLAAKTAAMMAAAVSSECARIGHFAAAERLRDLADEIERQDAEVMQ